MIKYMDLDNIILPEILFEFVVQGNFVKVMAVDPQTGMEIAMVGDARSPKKTLENLATRKLKMAIRRKYMNKNTQVDTGKLN